MRVLRRWMGLFGLTIIWLSACAGPPPGDGQRPVAAVPLPTSDIQHPTSTTAPLPTSDIQHPTSTTAPFPTPPADWRDAPAAIAAWLNAAPENPPRITGLIDEWKTALGKSGQLTSLGYYAQSHEQLMVSDLDGDGTAEIVIAMLGRTTGTSKRQGSPVSHLMVFYQDDGRYKAVTNTVVSGSRDEASALKTYLWKITDLTDDGRAEIITDGGFCGAHTCWGYPGIWQWSTAGLTDVLITGFYSPTDKLEPDRTSSFAEISLTDEDRDAIQELRVEGGGIQRRTVAIYAWDGAAYRLDRVEYAADDSEPFWKLIDAARLFRDGEYAAADELYRAILSAPEKDNEWGIPYSAVAQASRFQLMLTALLLDQPAQARSWHDELSAGGDPTWGDTFWDEYERSGRVRAGCQAVAAYAHSFEFKHTGYDNWTADRVTCVFR